MANKFDKAVQNRSYEILDSGKKQKIDDVVVVEDKAIEPTSFNLDDFCSPCVFLCSQYYWCFDCEWENGSYIS
ncbi:hypothetical protein [Clostridium tagluense]|uniref:Uncharacterized protein n=1 Tax=Clostridium tagluense TaxID=360422 RepID=A0A401US80_9CLOT|nr:hypothetical protein [Clostridium tagluense]GCD12364.1 hypothetical protein Ctaglu_39870 [Clostridium tagluense]